MTSEYQRQVRAGLSIEHGVDATSHCALGLSAEAGEVADLVKKSQYNGGSLHLGNLLLELGDTLWYVTALADRFGWTLEDLIVANVQKLEKRRGAPYCADAL